MSLEPCSDLFARPDFFDGLPFARDGGFFSITVMVRNRSTHWVTVPNYFSQFSWYQPGAVDVAISQLEETNVAAIKLAEH